MALPVVSLWAIFGELYAAAPIFTLISKNSGELSII
jgi:hypothetical protein